MTVTDYEIQQARACANMCREDAQQFKHTPRGLESQRMAEYHHRRTNELILEQQRREQK
jgi:hypothetical protein